MQVLSRTLSAHLNDSLLRKQVKQQFPARFAGLALGGYVVDQTLFTAGSTVAGRISVPRSQPFTFRSLDVYRLTTGDPTTFRVAPPSTFAPGECWFVFDPALSGPQIVTLDALIAAHDATATTARQAAEDADVEALNEMDAFLAGGAWNTRTNLEQNQHMHNLTRMVLRIWARLQASD
ncbi:MAG TPA: hypothetical protein VI229_00335 [Burkholderiales bacterium]